MDCSFFPPVRAALLGAAFVGLTATAASAASVQSGVLACNVAPGIGFVIGSSKTLSCVFHPVYGRLNIMPARSAESASTLGRPVPASSPGALSPRGLPAAAMRSPAIMAAPALASR